MDDAMKLLTAPEEIGSRLFEHGETGIFTIATDGRVLRANPAMLRFLGSPSEQTSQLFNVFTLPTIPEPARQVFRKVLQEGRPAELSIDYVSMHGKKTCLRLNILPVSEQGRMTGAIAQAFDVSSLRQAEEQLRRTSKLESLMLLAGSLAHDLNNVFTSLIGYAALLRKGGTGLSEERRNRALELLEQAAGSGAKLVEQMVSFTSERKAQTSACAFAASVRQAISLFSYGLPQNIRLSVDLPFDAEMVRGSANKIEQVVLNILLNARDAIGSEDGTIAVTAKAVPEAAAEAMPAVSPPVHGFIALALRDSGIGIPTENLSRIFDPYFTTKPHGRGTGLGLSSVWGILKEIGGCVHVESAAGKGSTFTIYLPVATEKDVLPREHAPVVHAAIGRGERILLVEAEPGLRELLVWILLNNGYKALAAEGCTAAREFLDNATAPIDAIVVGEENLGAECPYAGEEGVGLGKPILCLSGTAREILPASPSIGRLRKPFTPEQFLHALAALLAESRRTPR